MFKLKLFQTMLHALKMCCSWRSYLQVWCCKLAPYVNSLGALWPGVEEATNHFHRGVAWTGLKQCKGRQRAPSAILSIHVGVGHPLYQILSFGWILFAFGMEGDKYFRSYFSVAGFSLLRWNMQIEPWTAVALQSGWYFGGPYFKVSDSSISLNNSAV